MAQRECGERERERERERRDDDEDDDVANDVGWRLDAPADAAADDEDEDDDDDNADPAVDGCTGDTELGNAALSAGGVGVGDTLLPRSIFCARSLLMVCNSVSMAI